MKIIMYHYVRNNNDDYPNFNSLHENIFIRQIEFFKKTNGIGSAKSLLENITSGNIDNKYYLTFDDGFKEHSRFVNDYLSENNLTGLFFTSTKPLVKDCVLDVHKVHLLLGRYNANTLLSEAMKKISPEMLDDERITEFDKEIYKDQINSSEQKKFKRLFNYYLKYKYREEILNGIFEKYFDETEMSKSLYMNPKDVVDMHNAGHVIGSHTHTHRVLSRLSREEQTFEVEKSEKILSDIIGLKWLENKTLCYPYGGSESFNKVTEEILNQKNYKASFMVGNVKVTKNSVPLKQRLNRIDCNRFLKV